MQLHKSLKDLDVKVVASLEKNIYNLIPDKDSSKRCRKILKTVKAGWKIGMFFFTFLSNLYCTGSYVL